MNVNNKTTSNKKTILYELGTTIAIYMGRMIRIHINKIISGGFCNG